MSAIGRIIPAAGWLRAYRKADLRGDLSAGLTVAVMLIPQSMAYAMLAGLPPIVGLYASVAPLVIYALFGSSRQLAVGPVALDSLLVAAAIAPIVQRVGGGVALYVQLAVMLALMVGVIELVMGAARLGFIVNFLSNPVISGFTSAAALVIGLSQLKHLLGIELPRSARFHTLALESAGHLGELHPATALIGVVAVALLVGLKRWKPAFPAPLVAVAAGTLATWGLGLSDAGVAIIGEIPRGLPAPGAPALDLSYARELLPSALLIALIGFMEAISVGKAFARKNRYAIAPNQEFAALGLANIAGSLFGAYPVSGGLGRTAVNAQAGARTQLASLIAAALVALSLLLLTPLFYYLPRAVLGAIVIVAVAGLIDLKEIARLWRIKKVDAGLALLTLAATLLLGIQQGIALGIGASLALFIFRTTRPHTAVLGRLPGTDVYRNLKRFPEAREIPGVLILRVDAAFYFANVEYLKDLVNDLVLAECESLHALVVDASSINDLDSSAAQALEEIIDQLQAENIALYLAGAKGPVRDVLHTTGLWDRLGETHFPFTVQQAIDAIEKA